MGPSFLPTIIVPTYVEITITKIYIISLCSSNKETLTLDISLRGGYPILKGRRKKLGSQGNHLILDLALWRNLILALAHCDAKK